MRHVVRVVAKGFVGVMNPPPFTFASTPGRDDVWQGIKRGERNVNVWRYAEAGSSDTEAPPLGLGYQIDYADAFNTLAGWSLTGTGGTNYLKQLGTTGSKGLYHSDNTARAAVSYRSTAAGLTILKNMPWALRGQLYKIPSTQTVQRFTLRWHRYQLQVVRGNSNANGADYGIKIMRLTNYWTQTVEDSVNFLEDQATVSATDQAYIEAARAEIYADEQPVSGNISEDAPFEITFIPEPGGYLNIIIAGEKDISRTRVRHSLIVNQRIPPGTPHPVAMWEAGPLAIRCNGGAFQWQAAQLEFATTGNISFGAFNASLWNTDDAVFNLNRDEPPGTGIAAAIEPVAGTSLHKIVTAFATTDTRYTPFLYGVAAYVPGGTLSGSTGTVWDSADHLLSSGSTCIHDCELNVGTEMEPCYADVTILDPGGTVLNSAYVGGLGANEFGYDYEALENRRVDVSMNGVALFTNAVVMSAAVTTVALATPEMERTDIARNETGALLRIFDKWALLDEMPMKGFIYPGDGLYINDYLRLILRAAGESISDVGANLSGQHLANDAYGMGTPRKLPTAPPGETWQVMPDENETFGDYIRRIVDRWGMGYKVWLNGDGTWDWGIRPNLSVVKKAFAGAATNNPAASAGAGSGGRYTALTPLDFQRDFAEYGNFFAVEGAPGPDGKPLVSAKVVSNGVNTYIAAGPLGVRDKRHIGRLKRWPLVRDTSLRTFSEVDWVRRSLKAVYGQPGRYFAFETYCHAGRLFPGDVITVNGLTGLIVNMGSMSALQDRGSITCREVVL